MLLSSAFLFSSNNLFRAGGGPQVLPDEFAADADATTAAAADHVNVKKKFLTDGEKKKFQPRHPSPGLRRNVAPG